MNHLIKYKLFEEAKRGRKKISRNRDVQRAIQIVKQHGVDIKFLKLAKKDGAQPNGYASLQNNCIIVNSMCKDIEKIISILFHELGHFYCYDKKVFKEYHYGWYKEASEEGIKNMLRTAIKAERYVDNWGKEKMKEHFPHLKFKPGYTGNWAKSWILNHLYGAFEDDIIDIETEKLIKILKDHK